VLHGELVVGNTGDAACLDKLFAAHEIDTVMHFAAHTVVPESVSNPLKYYGNNTCGSRTLLEHSLRAKVKHFVFSSTGRSTASPATAKPPRTRRRRRSMPTACRSS
jgi:UDP-glucose 4-epimerase